MTEREFEARLRQMTPKGDIAPFFEWQGMFTDIDCALEELELLSAIKIVRTGQVERLLSVTATALGPSPEAVLRALEGAFEREIRYSGESVAWGTVEEGTVRLRFATGGDGLFVTGEIVVSCKA